MHAVHITTNLPHLADALRDIARRHDIPLVDTLTREPDITVDPDTSLDELEALLVSSHPLFLTVRQLPFDAEQAIDDLTDTIVDEEGAEDLDGLGEKGEALVRAQAGRNGTIGHVWCHWAGGGLIFRLDVRADWLNALEESVRETALDEASRAQVQATAARDAHWAAIGRAADELEAMPQFRATSSRGRKAIGEALAATIAAVAADPGIRYPVIHEACQRADRRAGEAFTAFAARQDDAAVELSGKPDWATTHSAPGRDRLAAAFLTEKTGYAPTKALTTEFRQLADQKRATRQ